MKWLYYYIEGLIAYNHRFDSIPPRNANQQGIMWLMWVSRWRYAKTYADIQYRLLKRMKMK